jgi:hypothetical protein
VHRRKLHLRCVRSGLPEQLRQPVYRWKLPAAGVSARLVQRGQLPRQLR